MASRFQGPFLWISLGLFGYLAASTAHKQLSVVRTTSEVKHEEKSRELIDQHTEDAIKLETLRVLTEGSNQEIRAAALKILTERASTGPTYTLMVEDIQGRNIERRDAALVAMKFLVTNAGTASINKYPLHHALVRCLVKLLHENKQSPSSQQDLDTNVTYRTQAERDALFILHATMFDSITMALQAGVVNSWLVNYPFGGPGASQSRKSEVVNCLKAGQSDDYAMSNIIKAISSRPEGRRELRHFKLIGEDDHEYDMLMIDDDYTSRGSAEVIQRRRRTREESEEERALRRRRREAMVLNEGGRPLGRDDIIQPINGPRFLNPPSRREPIESGNHGGDGAFDADNADDFIGWDMARPYIHPPADPETLRLATPGPEGQMVRPQGWSNEAWFNWQGAQLIHLGIGACTLLHQQLRL